MYHSCAGDDTWADHEQALPSIRWLEPNRHHQLRGQKKGDLRSLQEIRCVQDGANCTISPGKKI